MARKTPWDTRYPAWRPRWRRLGAKLALWAMVLQVLMPLGYPVAAQAFGDGRFDQIVIRTAVGEKSMHVGTPAGHDGRHSHHDGATDHDMSHADHATAAASHDEHHKDHGGPQCPICVIAQAISTGPLPTPALLLVAPDAPAVTLVIHHDDRHDGRAWFDHRARAPPA